VCSQVLILRKGRVVAHDSIGHLRESMHESSLEGIFGQLTREQDHRAVAEHILEVMQG
jgi:ABC-2 type transport system ATP-binding protein